MIDFTNTITIDRPVTEVYDYLADLRNVPEWNWAIETTEQLTPGTIRVGTAYRQTRHTPSRSVEYLRITALEPDELIAISGDLGPFSSVVSYTLESAGMSTRLDNRIQLEPVGPARLAAPVISGVITRSVADNLTTLKQNLEHRGTDTMPPSDWRGETPNQLHEAKRVASGSSSPTVSPFSTRRLTLPAVIYSRRT